jgi:hypothetical protein
MSNLEILYLNLAFFGTFDDENNDSYLYILNYMDLWILLLNIKMKVFKTKKNQLRYESLLCVV